MQKIALEIVAASLAYLVGAGVSAADIVFHRVQLSHDAALTDAS